MSERGQTRNERADMHMLRRVVAGRDSMLDAVSHRRQAEGYYELGRSSDDAMEGLSYVLKAMECEARAVDTKRGKQPPLYGLQPP